jgi:cytochrome c
MSKQEINKYAGAILLALLTVWVVGMIGDALVHPRHHAGPAMVAEGEPAPAPAGKPAAEPEKPAPIAALLAKASADKGARIARKCATCHSFDEGGKKKIGPNLWNIVNNKTAHESDFAYSKALQEMGGTWTYEALNAFIADPRSFVKGTKMTFPGLKKAEDRAAVIAYLRSLSKSPAPLP